MNHGWISLPLFGIAVIALPARSQESEERVPIVTQQISEAVVPQVSTSPSKSPAFEPNPTFFKAKEAYDAEQPAAAVALYEQILAEGQYSAELFYNLGNAWYQAGHPGQAIRNYRRAQRLSPRDPDLRNNLRFVMGKNGSLQPKENPAVEMLRRVDHGTWMQVAAVAFWCLTVGLSVALLLGRGRSLGPKILATFGLILLLGLIGGHFTAPQHLPNEVVILKDQQDARYAPLEGSDIFFTLPIGSIVIALDEQHGQIQIRSGKEKGWIPKEACAPVAWE